MRICLKLSDGWQKPFPVREVYEKMKTRICSSPQGTFIHSFFSRLAPTLSRPCSKTSGKANKASPTTRHSFSKACLQHSQTIIQPCMWFMEEPIQFPVGQTAQSLTCSILENPHTWLDDCLRMLQACFSKRMSEGVRERGEGRKHSWIPLIL